MRRLILFTLSTWPLFGDGGAVQQQREIAPFLITVFAAPVPLRAGPLDVSVLVQDQISLSPVLDAQVLVQTEGRQMPATHVQAQNKLLYATTVNIKQPGQERYSVVVRRNGNQATLSGVLQTAPAAPKWETYWSYLALPPCAIVWFGLNQWLRRSKMRREYAKS